MPNYDGAGFYTLSCGSGAARKHGQAKTSAEQEKTISAAELKEGLQKIANGGTIPTAWEEYMSDEPTHKDIQKQLTTYKRLMVPL